MPSDPALSPDHQVYIDMGRVLEAHEARRAARLAIDGAEKVKVDAERDVRALGHYEDCGDFYHSELDIAKRLLDEKVSAKIKAECRFKAMRLTFCETHPEQAALLEALLAEQSRRHAKSHPSHGQASHGQKSSA